MSPHALHRARQRFPEQVARIERAADKVARTFPDVAVASRIARLTYPHCTGIGADGLRKSNGDELWVIARLGRVETVFLRRSTQLHNPEAFDVDVVAYGLRVQATDLDVAA